MYLYCINEIHNNHKKKEQGTNYLNYESRHCIEEKGNLNDKVSLDIAEKTIL